MIFGLFEKKKAEPSTVEGQSPIVEDQGVEGKDQGSGVGGQEQEKGLELPQAFRLVKEEVMDAQVKWELEIQYPYLEDRRQKVIQKAAKDVEVPGFRKGKAPLEQVAKALNMTVVWEDVVREATGEVLPALISHSKARLVDLPRLSFQTVQEGHSLKITLHASIYPVVTIQDYAVLTVSVPDGDDSIESKREAAVEELLQKVQVTIPPIMIEREIDMILGEMDDTFQQQGPTLQEYLSSIHKEVATLRDEVRGSAQKRVQAKLALREVASREKIAASPEEVDAEIARSAEAVGEPLEKMKDRLGEEGRDYFSDFLIRRKALEYIVSKTNFVPRKEEPSP